MKLRVPTVIGIFLGIVVFLAFVTRSHSQPGTTEGGAIEGFGRLAWGTPVEQARAVYPDLYFGSYVVEGAREEPSMIYYRKDEKAEIHGVAFDYLQYWFRNNRFYKIRAAMRTGIGPRTLVTRSEESFDRVNRELVDKYGKPTKYAENYFIDLVTVTRVAEWDRSDAAIVLEYKGPEGTNEDQLVFELREGGRH